jgi:hypothetical protein
MKTKKEKEKEKENEKEKKKNKKKTSTYALLRPSLYSSHYKHQEKKKETFGEVSTV